VKGETTMNRVKPFLRLLDEDNEVIYEDAICPKEITRSSFGWSSSIVNMTFDVDIPAHYVFDRISPTGAPDLRFRPDKRINRFAYKKIIFSGPCTIVLWDDGTKTIARASEGDEFDPEKGVAVCFMKKIMGHTETNKLLRKAHDQYKEETK
jgi:hypothetical protein